MSYNRIHVRVPVDGTVTLKSKVGTHIGVRAIDISHGGLGVSCFPGETTPPIYNVVVTLKADVTISFTGKLIKHQNSQTAGFKIINISREDKWIINKLVEDYQHTDEFVRQLGEYEILPERYVDKDGNELEITFERD